jgi:hypothetical protein
MCGRYYSLFDKQQVAEHFHVRRTADNVGIIAPNYNAAPGDLQPVTAANIIIDASGLTAGQFNSFQPGRYSSYGGQFLLGFGMAGHIANEPGVNAGAVFGNSNIGGNLSVHFAFHDDHGYANNPLGALIHFFTDVLGHNSRKPC